MTNAELYERVAEIKAAMYSYADGLETLTIGLEALNALRIEIERLGRVEAVARRMVSDSIMYGTPHFDEISVLALTLDPELIDGPDA